MPSHRRCAPVGYKWVIKYTCRDGKPGMGLSDDHFRLPLLIELLIEDRAKDISIADETFYKDE